jgi:hypothetical protein
MPRTDQLLKRWFAKFGGFARAWGMIAAREGTIRNYLDQFAFDCDATFAPSRGGWRG